MSENGETHKILDDHYISNDWGGPKSTDPSDDEMPVPGSIYKKVILKLILFFCWVYIISYVTYI